MRRFIGNRVTSTLAKLSPKQVRDIRRKASIGIPQRSLAGLYGVSQATISYILSGKIYRRVA